MNAKADKSDDTTDEVKPQAETNVETTDVDKGWPDAVLVWRSSGPDVEQLQRRLIELGWLDEYPTGGFTDETVAAVSHLQRVLRDEGEYDGPINGVWTGALAASASKLFEETA